VNFSNKSIGDIVGSIWNFGDGTDNSSDPDASHTYTKGGYYNVCLTVTNSSGIRNMGCKWVLVAGSATNDCRANFMFSIDSANLKVNFVDNSYGDIDKYNWDFGDSKSDSVSSEQNPEHFYSGKGYYLVHLKVENTVSGCISSEYKLLNVAENQVLKASFGYEAKDPDKKLSGYPVDLVSASSGDGATVEWDFGDKQIKKESFTVMDSTSRIVTHYYEKPGKYLVCLRISDPVSGQSDTYCQNVITKFGVGIIEENEDMVYLNIYPNPFIDHTTIRYALSKNQFIELGVYDQLGKRIETLVKARKDAGDHEIVWETKNLATGIYHLKLVTVEGIVTKQLVIIR
jgi:PKD repeat protein